MSEKRAREEFPFVEPKESKSIAALLTEYELMGPADPELSKAFAARWTTDVAPVHDRTERSRTYRTVYIVSGVGAAILINFVALLAFPFVFAALGMQAGQSIGFVNAERLFVAGAAVGLVELVIWFIVLDADVMRQKRERLATRLNLAMNFAPEAQAKIAAFKDNVRRVESFYWRMGVGLTWTNVVLQLLAFGLFVAGASSAIDAMAGLAAGHDTAQ